MVKLETKRINEFVNVVQIFLFISKHKKERKFDCIPSILLLFVLNSRYQIIKTDSFFVSKHTSKTFCLTFSFHT